MNILSSFTTVLLTLTLVVALAGCQKVSLSSIPGMPGSKTEPATKGGTEPQPAATATPPAAPLEGYWTIAFKFGDNVSKASLQIHQEGNQLSGSGTDEDSNRAFNITGTVDGQTVKFEKQYEVPDSKVQVPAVQYDGTYEMVNEKDYQGPYMHGQYSTIVNGNQVSDEFEAQLTTSQGQAATGTPEQPAGGEQASQPAPTGPPDGKAPDLSGKWKTAYKFNFKTIKSTMFLLQDGGHLTGRGVDQNTNEKFEIEKGWYNFPKVTIVRTYKKGKGGAASDRTATFKGSVEWVNEKDYQGPYLHGETQGGGDWEAQLVR
jgi:hypothetical protein